MSEHNITVEGGSSVRLKTAGKYCDRDIVVTSTGGGGGSEDLDAVLTAQEEKIAELEAVLDGKAVGGGGDVSNNIQWATRTYEIEIGENTISNSADATAYVKTLVDSYTSSIIVLESPLTVNNQLLMCGITAARWRNGLIGSVTVGSNYDAFVVEGTKYVVYELS